MARLTVQERREIARALTKAQAFADAGNAYDRDLWTAELVRLLGAADILRSTMVQVADDEFGRAIGPTQPARFGPVVYRRGR
jgi:hypothetical protein